MKIFLSATSLILTILIPINQATGLHPIEDVNASPVAATPAVAAPGDQAPNISAQEKDSHAQRKRIGKHTSSYPQEIKASFSNMEIEKLPLPVKGQIFVQTATGPILKTDPSLLCQGTNALTAYSSGNLGETNYLASGDKHRQESFAHTRTTGYSGSRKYPLKTYTYKHVISAGVEITFDRGHGIDHADGNAMSSQDLRNYTPQNSFYNRHIRNPLVGAIRKENGCYREVAVYDPTNSILIGGITRLPVGFLFLEYYGHIAKKMYYFPNLIDYKSLKDNSGEELVGYEKFCEYFEVIENDELHKSVVEEGKVDEHRKEVHNHSRLGYRLLSGRHTIEKKQINSIPKEAETALVRMLAIYNLQQAGTLEFDSVEEKAALIRTLTNKMRYTVLERGNPLKEEARRKDYQALEEALSQEITFSDSEDDSWLFFMLLANPDKLKPEARMEKDRILKILEKNPVREENQEGESLYDLEEAKKWLSVLEQEIATSSNIEDKLTLLELYDIPEIEDAAKKMTLAQKLEEQAEKSSTLDEKRQIAEYFFYQESEHEKSSKWLAAMDRHLNEGGTIEEKTNAADWYSRGMGVVPCDIEKAKSLYEELLASSDISESAKARIARVLSTLSDAR